MDPEQVVAIEMRRLGEMALTRRLGDDALLNVAGVLAELCDRYDEAEVQPKEARFGGKNRVVQFLETGEWPEPPPDGSQMDFDIASVVGGELHPSGIGVRYFRDGDEAVGRVVVNRSYEGPPGRVHGGAIAAIFDEVMGSVFRATGTPSAFTGELAVRFVGPAPLGVELEFRAREVRTEGRKRFLEGEASSPDGVFATATSTFINMRTEDLPTSVL